MKTLDLIYEIMDEMWDFCAFLLKQFVIFVVTYLAMLVGTIILLTVFTMEDELTTQRVEYVMKGVFYLNVCLFILYSFLGTVFCTSAQKEKWPLVLQMIFPHYWERID
ncbi:hypothetical protein H6775_02530 [Candidatus Nomurabacteria bacterium]|nr:hypothetical protein [Candidatus Nomurabacteria bacterium]